MARALESDTSYYGEEIVVERPDGRRITVLAHANPIHDASGHLVGAVNCLVDISDRTNADEARMRLASIVDSSDDAIISKTLDGTILSWNAGAERLFGYPAEQAIGRSIELIIPPAYRGEERLILDRLRRGERIEHFETVRVSRTGRLIDISLCISPLRDTITGEVIGASKVARDISERKRWAREQVAFETELTNQLEDLERLQEMSVRLFTTRDLQPILEEVLRTATSIEGTTLGVLSLVDPESGALIPGARLGIPEEIMTAVESRPMGGATGLCHSERRRIVVVDILTDPRFEGFRDIAEKAGIRAIHSTPLITRSGVSVGVLSTHFRDPHTPSAREKHMADLCARQAVDFIENARLYAQLLDADRAKNEFLAVLAHELRNPLAPIVNATRILRLAPAGSETSEHALLIVDRQMRQMTRLIDDLLDVARITSDKLELRSEVLEVSEVMLMAVETSGPAINQRNLELVIDAPAESTMVHGDPVRLAQVVSNLLDNAAKFTAPRGRIRLSARREGAEAVIAVEDTGIGIPPAMLPKIFDLFTQANLEHDATHRGLGIGLTLVKRLVALHGGSVSAISDGPDRGSRFEVRLPLSMAAVAEPVDRPTVSAPAIGAIGRRVLVVEDNQDSAATMKTLLGLLGHHVRTVHDGRAALEAAEEFRPEVVLLDIGIPLLNGHEVARRIRKESWGEQMLLIATTGWSAPRDMELSRSAGFDHHLVKPVDPERLRGLIQGGNFRNGVDAGPSSRS